MPPKRTPWQPRFWIKVSKTDKCWNWTGHIAAGGYGRFRQVPGGKSYAAHRLSYELLVGEIPAGADLDHLCRNRRCVNPAHLEPVTRAENLHRGITEHWGAHHRSKTECPSGHPLSGENLYVRPDRPNRRECKICRTAASQRYRNAVTSPL